MKKFFCLVVFVGLLVGNVGSNAAQQQKRRVPLPEPVPLTRPLPPPTSSTVTPSYPQKRPEAGAEILPGMETGRDKDLYMAPLPEDGHDLYGNTYRGMPHQ